MKALLSALLLLAAAPASAWHPECDETGFAKTIEACGTGGERAGTSLCRHRLAGTIKNCNDRIRDNKKPSEVAFAQAQLPQLLPIETIQRTLPDPGPASKEPLRAPGTTPDGGPDDPSEQLEDARQALQAGEPHKALKLVQRALEQNPNDVDALRLRAQINLDLGDKDAAAADARRILQLAPDDEFARVVLGQSEGISRSSGKLKGVKLEFDSKEDGEFAGPRGGMDQAAVRPGTAAAVPGPRATGLQVWQAAQRFFSLGDWTSALFHATRYLKLAPDDPKGWILRARISNRLKNWAAAESDARRALELSPDDPAALLELAYAELQQGRAAEALAHIERALTLDPKNGLGHFYLGQTLEALGRKREAIEAYRAAARLDNGLIPLVDAALARLEPGGGVPAPLPPPPWRAPLRLVTLGLAAAFLLKGLQYVFGARRRATTAPPIDPSEPPPHGTPVPGTVLGGQFRIERELARGGMGVVFEATDTVLNRPVAIKRLNRTANESADARRKFLQEAQLAARLTHPNLAQIFSVFEEGGLYLVFELVDGAGLDAILARRGSLGLEEVRGLIRQACSALAHAHANRVIHRDLKPANMMVARDGTLKLMDFGIAHEARTISAATATQAWGTPPYMAPEQEDGFVLPASDLYALAVTAYELLSGRLPFNGPGLSAQKRNKRFAPLGGTGGLDGFFARALDPDPARRFASAAEFAEAFEALADTPVRG